VIEEPTMAIMRNGGSGAANDGRLHAPKDGITVRMYRTGLGDCFLLALPRAQVDEDGRTDFYMLIDCGVYFRTPKMTDPDTNQEIDQEAWIQKIANHIKAATGGYIDVVAITHEHWDHVSGFHEDQAQEVFGSIKIGGLWMAWTEDMSIELARKLKTEGGADHDTLARAIAEMEKRRGMGDSRTFQMSGKMLGFFGAKAGSPKKYSKETGRAMEWIQTTWAHANKVKPEYFHPGQRTPLPGVDPDLARVYVLGPPEDEKVIKVCDRKGAAYRMGIDWPAAAACFVAFGVLPSADTDAERAREMNIPFDKRHHRTEADYEKAHPKLYNSYRTARLRLMPSLKTDGDIPTRGRNLIVVAAVNDVLHFRIFHDGKIVLDSNEKALKKKPEPIKVLKEKLEPLWSKALSTSDEDALLNALSSIVELPADNRWRTIDHDWAEPAAAFALQLDNKTNNTSFAFALEIGPPGEGKVLLFPGDAQVGNWLSWFGPVKVQGEKEPVGKALEWKAGNTTITAEDLMRRTVLYKVGHHGSHNATLRTRDKQPCGLQFMTSKELVALIPIDEFVARKKAGYGDMPLPEIVSDLLRMTDGRVTRNDEDAGYSKDDAPVLNGVGLHGRQPKKTFKGKRTNALYIEYDVTL
jgi:hypothetical protein